MAAVGRSKIEPLYTNTPRSSPEDYEALIPFFNNNPSPRSFQPPRADVQGHQSHMPQTVYLTGNPYDYNQPAYYEEVPSDPTGGQWASGFRAASRQERRAYDFGVPGIGPTTRTAYTAPIPCWRFRKSRGNQRFFICLTLSTIVSIYSSFWILYYDLSQVNESWWLTAVPASFNIFTFFLMWSYLQALLTDAGSVPRTWGFLPSDGAKRKRYCRTCNVWKPERGHHCSVCDRCVLNMDHHCPYIGNCVGFYNRKFFIQLLVYAQMCILTYLALVIYYCTTRSSAAWSAFEARPWIISRGFKESTIPETQPPPLCREQAYQWLEFILQYAVNVARWVLLAIKDIVLAYISLVATLFTGLTTLGTVVLEAALWPFTRAHLNYVKTNSTTIESLDQVSAETNRYNIGVRNNIEQVFGKNVWLWWLPMHLHSSQPAGDGIRWTQHFQKHYGLARASERRK